MFSTLSVRQGLIGGLAAVLDGGHLLYGTVQARPNSAQNTPGATDRQQAFNTFVDRLASNLGTSKQTLHSALIKTRQSLVDDKVSAGQLTPEQAARIKQRIQDTGGMGG